MQQYPYSLVQDKYHDMHGEQMKIGQTLGISLTIVWTLPAKVMEMIAVFCAGQ